MRTKLGMALSIFVGIFLISALVIMAHLKTETSVPLVLAIIGASITGVWAVTNASSIVILFKGSWNAGIDNNDQGGGND